ncbi:acyltransferase family protein [Acidovorax sp.]|uniref:acyltransferase family protein n=1 Tax=Acidovorax sp. TaxID=1872122 RepID=UPI00391F9094
MNDSRNHAIETLRAAAVVMVFMNHLHSMDILTIPYFGISGGWLGVQIFFVISGYLIIQSAARYSAPEYIKHRALRIYPAYLFWFIAFSVITGSLAIEKLDINSLLTHLLFLQHFSPSAFAKYSALPVSWTLTVEAAWYVLAFIIASYFYRSPTKSLFFSVAIACFWINAVIHLKIFPSIQDPGQRYFFLQNNAIAQMPFFLIGAWIAVKKPPQHDKAALLSVIISTIFLFKSWELSAVTPIFITGLGVAALFLILRDIDYKNHWSIKWMSEISYSFYLIHYPTIILLSVYIGNKYILSIISFVATVILSFLSYFIIEKPFIRLARSVGDKK